ncbi:MAG: hypothetical protein EBV68_10565 [Betaproteobacteria bacterium]|nr:hypothetical protein [Betaproteobacteria bacterium]
MKNVTIDHAISLQRSAKFFEASQIYREFVVIDPANSLAIHYLGMAQLQLGSVTVALSFANRAIRTRLASTTRNSSMM